MSEDDSRTETRKHIESVEDQSKSDERGQTVQWLRARAATLRLDATSLHVAAAELTNAANWIAGGVQECFIKESERGGNHE